MSELVRASPSDLGEICPSLARAFLGDPVATWLFPTSRLRERDLRRFFAIQLRYGFLPRGVVMATPDRLACAMWISSWAAPPSPHDRLGHLQIPFLLRSRLRVARELTRVLGAAHPRSPHLYLGTIGVSPDAQANGYGGALVEAFTGDADRQGAGAYLECSTRHNVDFYRRFGFEVIGEVGLPDGGPVLWLMWREPRGST